MEYTKRTYICNHCGNESIMQECGNFENESSGEYFYYEKNTLLKCLVCYKPLLHNTCISDDDFDEDDAGNRIPTNQIIYPKHDVNSRFVPVKIKHAYEAALRTRGIDFNIFALALRRTLELIVEDNNASGRNLSSKIKNLSDSGVLPSTLNEAANITRLIGNIGAHSTMSNNLTEHDLNKISKFVEYIINYIYILPNEIIDISDKSS